jgi:predicted amidohydrolase
MKTLIVQKNVTNTDIHPFLKQAQAGGFELVCFNELALTGLLYESADAPEFLDVLEELEPYTFRIMLGLPITYADRLYNGYLYKHEDRILTYYKRNLFEPFSEDKVFDPGLAPGIWKMELGKIGIAICYDIRFDNIFTLYRNAAVSTIFVPAAFPRVRVDQWRELLVRRAKETGVTVVGINAVGDDGRNEFGGASMVVNGEGEVLASADETSETVLEIDL